MRAFIFGVLVALAFDWLFLVPGFLFGTCAWSSGCNGEQQAKGHEDHARLAREWEAGRKK